MSKAEERALRLAGRYARLNSRMCECKRTSQRLFGMCERPTYIGDERTFGQSGCLATLDLEMQQVRYLGGEMGDGFDFLGYCREQLGFCRPCLVGLKLSRHRKRVLVRRRASALGAITRLGKAVNKEASR